MIVTLQTQGLHSLEQICAFLGGSQPLGFETPQGEITYEFVAQTLGRFGHTHLGKADKGLLRRYLCKVTGRSRAQMTRLIAQFRKTGRIQDRRGAPALCASLYPRGRAVARQDRHPARYPLRPRHP